MPGADAKRIVIVGNADVSRDYSGFIDSCDVVVRLNLRNSIPAVVDNRLGHKTDVVCFAPRAARMVLDDWQNAAILAPLLKDTRRIWFVSPKPWFRVRPMGFIRFLLKHRRLAFNASTTMVKSLHLQDRQIEYFTKEFRDSVQSKLRVPAGEASTTFPSAGQVVIQRILEDPEFEPYQKYICGFTFDGWQGHPFAHEKRLVESYAAQRRLHLLPVD